MLRRRTTLSVTAAAAVVVAAPLLTGCGNDARAGAAAVLDGDRIKVSEVQARSEVVREAQRGELEGDAMIANSGWLNRASLDTMIRYRIIERAAQDAEVSVSRREVQRSRAETERQPGGENLESVLLHQRTLAPEQIDEDIRIQLLLEKVAESKGLSLRTPQGQAQIMRLLSKTSKALDIKVNPRFGSWNDQEVGLADAEAPWLREMVKQRPQGQPLA